MAENIVDLIVLGLFLLSGAFGLASSVAFMEMADQVNSTRPPERQFGLRGWGPFSFHPVIQEYRRLYPRAPLLRRGLILSVVGLGIFTAGVLILFPWFLGLAFTVCALASISLGVFIAYRR
jgi:hypothetical protein